MTFFFCLFVLFFTVARLFISTHLGLADDEAYYWDWSRVLSWSYYDHPGITAWLIYLSRQLFEDSLLAVRLPALLLNTIGWIYIWKVSKEMFGLEAAFFSGVLYALIPLFMLGGLMMVPDIPMIVCWILVMAFGWQILEHDSWKSPWGWVGIGVIMGIGTLSKYTMVLAGLSLILFVLVTPAMHRHLKTPWPWVAVLVWGLFCFPIFYWNMKNHWASFQFQMAGRWSGPKTFGLSRWGNFWFTQVGYLTPLIFLILAATLIYGLRKWQDLRWRYLVCFALPTVAIFSLQGAFTEFKPHWPAPGYIALLIGSGVLLSQQFRRHRTVVVFLALVFIIPLNMFLYAELFYPLAPKVFRQVNHSTVWNPKWDPTNDLYGWPEAAEHVRQLQIQNPGSDGSLPFLAAHRYQLASELAFASKQKVRTFSESPDAFKFFKNYSHEELVGRDAVVVGDNRYPDTIHQRNLFSSCEPASSLDIRRGREVARTFTFWICHGFKG